MDRLVRKSDFFHHQVYLLYPPCTRGVALRFIYKPVGMNTPVDPLRARTARADEGVDRSEERFMAHDVGITKLGDVLDETTRAARARIQNGRSYS